MRANIAKVTGGESHKGKVKDLSTADWSRAHLWPRIGCEDKLISSATGLGEED